MGARTGKPLFDRQKSGVTWEDTSNGPQTIQYRIEDQGQVWFGLAKPESKTSFLESEYFPTINSPPQTIYGPPYNGNTTSPVRSLNSPRWQSNLSVVSNDKVLCQHCADTVISSTPIQIRSRNCSVHRTFPLHQQAAGPDMERYTRYKESAIEYQQEGKKALPCVITRTNGIARCQILQLRRADA